ncbi:MAG: YggT family protein [Pseudomonadota bacterium]
MAALVFLISTAFTLLSTVFILRFLLYAVRAEFHNPLSQFVYRVTNPVIAPLRKVIPNVGGVELATVLAVIVIEAVSLVVVFTVLRGITLPLGGTLLEAVLQGVLATLRCLIMILIVNALLSWAPGMAGHPVARLLGQIADPVLRPIRSVLPAIAGFDLSPLVAIIALQAIMIQLSTIHFLS